ncbi:MAG: DinB family protein [Bacteroidetes bacterium]|nr:DinB family protein [Bacteroidota bacterium]
MNPADSQETLITRYLEGPALLERTVSGIHDEELDADPSTNGWTIRQIVHHIVDGDDLWKVGIKAALGDTPGEFTLEWYWCQPQEVWAERWSYGSRSIDVSLALLKASRAHVSQLLETIPDGWNRSVAVRKLDGEIVRLSVEAVVTMQTQHLEHHVNRIKVIRQERGRA